MDVIVRIPERGSTCQEEDVRFINLASMIGLASSSDVQMSRNHIQQDSSDNTKERVVYIALSVSVINSEQCNGMSVKPKKDAGVLEFRT
ncbi:hypothetical protein PAXRUDRAFT_829641 [Paxillus rubicundulus Ve08.2h10]|uniref:Unplaced genomic scaffold scaffold_422, whole genome shotgun sequence n=1 Tax=Paxillus rubicundulus Ve08.2h10 TaxID=930991 RepID=A0A0D0DUK7_9AGAM|nr:hypothetical protein PAXRUDRAFT_829641 [Paxillus rubicundulus Ve08.2h10]